MLKQVGEVVGKLSKYVAGAAIVGAMAFSAGSASAVTFSGINDSDAEANATVLADRLVIDFDWDGTPVTSFVEFTIDTNFDLNLTNYVGGADDQTGFTVDVLNGLGLENRLTQQGGFCSSAEAPVAGNCNLVANPGANIENEFVSPLTTVFADLAAGSYRIGILDGNTPSQGALSFEAVGTVVPLPAGLVLFLSGLGVLGFVSRRKA